MKILWLCRWGKLLNQKSNYKESHEEYILKTSNSTIFKEKQSIK